MKRLKTLAVIASLLFFAAAGVAQAEMTTIYGPVYFSKANKEKNNHGHDKDFKVTFTAPLPGKGVIIVKNGAESGKKYRVSKAEIELNGQEIARPKDFKKNAEVIEYNVELLADNEMKVEVESCKVCKIEVSVLGEIPVVREVPPPVVAPEPAPVPQRVFIPVQTAP